MRENYNPANSVNGEDLVVSNPYTNPIDEDQYDALTFIEHELGLTFEGRDNMSAQLFINEYHYEAQQSELDRLEYLSTLALSEDTLVPLSDGTKKLLKDIAEGDEILNNKGEPTTVIDKLNLNDNEEITEEKEVIKDTSNSLVELTSAQIELVDEILEAAQRIGYISYRAGYISYEEYEDGLVTEEDMEMRTSEDIWEVRRKLKGAK